MVVNWNGLGIGILFGAALLLAGIADPDKIIGMLRLKDFHALRTIAVFIIVSMLGVWLLDLAGYANYSIKPAAIISNIIGGALLGVGMGLTGYCPGTGLACAASGRIDASLTVLGMLLGAFVFILIYPCVVTHIDKIADLGKVTIPQITNTPKAVWVIPIVLAGSGILAITAGK